MRVNRAVPALIAVLGLPTSAWSDFSAGWAAYKWGDYATAFEVIVPVAEKGDARAQYSLGRMYRSGNGVPQDYAEAANWWRLAAEQGSLQGAYGLGLIYENGNGVSRDYVLALMWYNLAEGWPGAREEWDAVAGRLKPADISKAQKPALEWRKKHQKPE